MSPPQGTQASDAESDSDDDTFKLVVQSAIAKAITLTVRPTTKCGAIVKAFLKKAGVADKYPAVFGIGGGKKKGGKDPRLCVDGDKMENDVQISEADLEDGDQVEIVGL
jgi:Ubiquitin-2 like Rad60 SUMO-like